MKKRLLALTMTALLAFGLAACGGSGNAKPETAAPETEAVTEAAEETVVETETAAPETEAITETEAAASETETEAAALEEEAGTYYELSFMDDGEGMTVDAETLHRMGAGYILLRDDGTGMIVLIGEDPEELKWDENNIIADGGEVPYTMDGDVLHMEKDGLVMEFTKTTWGELNTSPEPVKPAEGYDPDHRQGYYKLVSINNNGEVTDASMLEAFGMSIYMVLNEDGSGNIIMFGEPMKLSWDDSSITIDGEAAEYVYLDGVISIVAQDSTMDFVYAGTPEEAPEPETETETEE